MVADDLVFLIHPSNRRFLRGETRGIANAGKWLFGMDFLALVLLCASVVFGSQAYGHRKNWLAWRQLAQDGVPIQAQVVDLWTEENDDSTSYRVTYRFQVPAEAGPQSYERTGGATRKNFDSLRKGGPVMVLYSASAPEVSRIPSDQTTQFYIDKFRANTLESGIPALVLGLVGFGLLAFTVRKHLQTRFLARHGELLAGRITQCTGQLDSEEDFQVQVSYAFDTPTGGTIRGQLTEQRNDLKGQPLPAADTPLAVLFLDEKRYCVL